MADEVNIVARGARSISEIPFIRNILQNTRSGTQAIGEFIGETPAGILESLTPQQILNSLASNDPLEQSLAGLGVGIPIIKPIRKVANPILDLLRGLGKGSKTARPSRQALQAERKARFDAPEGAGTATTQAAARSSGEVQGALKGAFNPKEFEFINEIPDLPLDDIARNPQLFRESKLGKEVLKGAFREKTIPVKDFDNLVSEFRVGTRKAAETTAKATAKAEVTAEKALDAAEDVAQTVPVEVTPGVGGESFLRQIANRPLRTGVAVTGAALAPGVGLQIGESAEVQDLISKLLLEPGAGTGELLGLVDPSVRTGLREGRLTSEVERATAREGEIDAGEASLAASLGQPDGSGTEILSPARGADLTPADFAAETAAPTFESQLLDMLTQQTTGRGERLDKLIEALAPAAPVEDTRGTGRRVLDAAVAFGESAQGIDPLNQQVKEEALRTSRAQFSPQQELIKSLFLADQPRSIDPIDLLELSRNIEDRPLARRAAEADIGVAKARAGALGRSGVPTESENITTQLLKMSLARILQQQGQ